MVKVLNLNVNPENPRNGFFELDWNDEFVNMLSQSGYQGASEEHWGATGSPPTPKKLKN